MAEGCSFAMSAGRPSASCRRVKCGTYNAPDTSTCSNVTMLREFLYVDVTRVRSLLAQLDQGVLEKVVERRGESKDFQIGAAVFGIGAEHNREGSYFSEESRSVQDLLFTIFEEAVTAQGILRDVTPEELGQPASWESSNVHRAITEGELLKLFVPIVILDPPFLEARIERVFSLTEHIAEIQKKALEAKVAEFKKEAAAAVEAKGKELTASGIGRDQATTEKMKVKRQLDQLLKATVEAAEKETTAAVGADVKATFDVIQEYLTSDSISVRFLACGEEHPEFSFSGSLLGREEYIQNEREALFSRYGSHLSGWTAIVQVAAIPTREAGEEARKRDFANLESFAGSTGVNRAAIEQAAIQLLGTMEATGISEGPLWPGISVIPLGIYRSVPRSDAPLAIPDP